MVQSDFILSCLKLTSSNRSFPPSSRHSRKFLLKESEEFYLWLWFIYSTCPQIDDSLVVGKDAVVSAVETVKGGLLRRGLTGDSFRVWEKRPQVQLHMKVPVSVLLKSSTPGSGSGFLHVAQQQPTWPTSWKHVCDEEVRVAVCRWRCTSTGFPPTVLATAASSGPRRTLHLWLGSAQLKVTCFYPQCIVKQTAPYWQ